MALLDDLNGLRSTLRAISTQFDDDGDVVSSRRIDNAVLSVEDAIRMEQAADIIAGLPSDADAKSAKDMLDRMNQVAATIQAEQAQVTRIVQVANGFASIVSDLGLGHYPEAAKAALSLAATINS